MLSSLSLLPHLTSSCLLAPHLGQPPSHSPHSSRNELRNICKNLIFATYALNLPVILITFRIKSKFQLIAHHFNLISLIFPLLTIFHFLTCSYLKPSQILFPILTTFPFPLFMTGILSLGQLLNLSRELNHSIKNSIGFLFPGDLQLHIHWFLQCWSLSLVYRLDESQHGVCLAHHAVSRSQTNH